MDKKKNVLVIIFATLLALLVAFVFFKIYNNKIKNVEPKQEIVQEEIKLNDEEEVLVEEIKEEIIERKEAPVAQPKKETVAATKPIKKEEAPVIKSIQVEEVKVVENKIEENNKDCGIIKDAATNEIVITREFKTTTPNKYSFK